MSALFVFIRLFACFWCVCLVVICGVYVPTCACFLVDTYACGCTCGVSSVVQSTSQYCLTVQLIECIVVYFSIGLR